MISALIQGTLHKPAVQRMGKVPFVTAVVRTPHDGNEAIFVQVIAFEETACRALLAPHDRAPVALAGTLSVGIWVQDDVTPRPQIKMVANAVLTLASARRQRGAHSRPSRTTPSRSTRDAL